MGPQWRFFMGRCTCYKCLPGGFPAFSGGFPVFLGGFPTFSGGFPAFLGRFPVFLGGFLPSQVGSLPNHVIPNRRTELKNQYWWMDICNADQETIFHSHYHGLMFSAFLCLWEYIWGQAMKAHHQWRQTWYSLQELVHRCEILPWVEGWIPSSPPGEENGVLMEKSGCLIIILYIQGKTLQEWWL